VKELPGAPAKAAVRAGDDDLWRRDVRGGVPVLDWLNATRALFVMSPCRLVVVPARMPPDTVGRAAYVHFPSAGVLAVLLARLGLG
jgi:hypothetical protein